MIPTIDNAFVILSDWMPSGLSLAKKEIKKLKNWKRQPSDIDTLTYFQSCQGCRTFVYFGTASGGLVILISSTVLYSFVFHIHKCTTLLYSTFVYQYTIALTYEHSNL